QSDRNVHQGVHDVPHGSQGKIATTLHLQPRGRSQFGPAVLFPLARTLHHTKVAPTVLATTLAERLMPGIPLPLQRSFTETKRADNWWLPPAAVFVGLSAFIVYSTWSALQGEHYTVPGTNYLSPFYSPEL